MPALSPRRSIRKALLTALAFFALALVSLALWVYWAGERRWSEMIRTTHEMLAEAQRRDGTREVLRGDPQPGNAWVEYLAAQARLTTLVGQPTYVSLFQNYLDGNPGLETADLDAALNACAPALAAFRRGVQRGDGKYPRDWSRYYEESPGSLGLPPHPTRNLAILVLAHARREAESGHSLEAARWALDLVRYKQDLWDCDAYGMDECGFKGLDELRVLLSSRRFSIAELAEIGRELEILDRSFPKVASGLMDMRIYLGQTFEHHGALHFSTLLGRPGLRHAFSPQLQVLEWTAIVERGVRRLSGCDGLSWGSETALWEQFRKEMVGVFPPGSDSVGAWKGVSSDLRTLRARLRLLRMAVGYLEKGLWPNLEDPFGSKLLHKEAKGRVTIWSVGPDGVDDGGSGGWKPGDVKDIVLEIGG